MTKIIALLLPSVIAFAFQIGQNINLKGINDQFDKPLRPSANLTHIIYTQNRDLGESFFDFVEANPSFMDQKTYIANITQVPSFVIKAFMKPALRKKPYKVGLITNKDTGRKMAFKSGFYTIFEVLEGKIVAIRYIKDLKGL